jgi:hypothetical protein
VKDGECLPTARMQALALLLLLPLLVLLLLPLLLLTHLE